MMQTATKYSVVNCDICGDRMKKQNDVYACYPCKHVVYESELYLNDANVEVHILGATKGEMYATSGD